MGSVDFLGNPMGLINDVSSGLEGLVKRGNVGGLFMNVAHGVSDSAAKVSKQRSITKLSVPLVLSNQTQPHNRPQTNLELQYMLPDN